MFYWEGIDNKENETRSICRKNFGLKRKDIARVRFQLRKLHGLFYIKWATEASYNWLEWTTIFFPWELYK